MTAAFKIRAIHNAAEHEAALEEIQRLWDSPGEAAQDALEVLAILVADYERNVFPEFSKSLDPVETIEARMDLLGMDQAQLGRILGSRSRASEILARKRELTKAMIVKLSDALNVPAERLLAQPRSGEAAVRLRPRAAAKARR